jgi:hypothetical protein
MHQPEGDWYKPGPKIAEFHDSRARKTTAIAVDAIRHCLFNPGAQRGIRDFSNPESAGKMRASAAGWLEVVGGQ